MPGNYSTDGFYANPYETIYDAFHDVSYETSAEDIVSSSTERTFHGNLGFMQVAMEKPHPYFLNYQHLQARSLSPVYPYFNEDYAYPQLFATEPPVTPDMFPNFFEPTTPKIFATSCLLNEVYDIDKDDHFPEIAEAKSPSPLPAETESPSPLPAKARSPSPLLEQVSSIQKDSTEPSGSSLELKEPLKMALDDLVEEACSSSTDVVEEKPLKENMRKKNHWKVLEYLRDKALKLIDNHCLTDMADLKVLLSKDDRSVFVTRYKLLKECQEKLEANKWAGMDPPSPVKYENNHWTFEKCMAEALKFDGRSEWRVASQQSYSAATKNHWLASCTEHMGSEGKAVWTKEKCVKTARRFLNISEWKKQNPGAYQIARTKNWMEECTEHMDKPYRKLEGKKPAGYWTLDNCVLAARQSKSFSQFKEKFSGAWKAVRKNVEWRAICETCFTEPHIR